MRLPKLKNIKDFVVNHPLLNRLEQWARSRSLPGFFKVPIFDVAVFLYHELRRYDLITRANSIAYSFFLSLFPALIALFTTLPLLRNYLLRHLPQGEDFNEIMQAEIKRIMPGIAGDRVFSFYNDLVNNPRIVLQVLTFIMAVFFASNGMMALMRGFEKSYMRTFKKRKGLRKRAIGILLTFSVGFFLIVSIVLIILGQFLTGELANLMPADRFSGVLLTLIRWIAIILLYYLSIAIIYRYGAPTRRRFKILTPGAALATTLCILSSLIFSFYVDNFSAYNTLYGSIGAIIVLMLWIQINSLFILIGFELNASIAVNRDLKVEKPETEEDL